MVRQEITGRVVSPSLSGNFTIAFDDVIRSITPVSGGSRLPIISNPLVETHIHGGSGFAVDGSVAGFEGTLVHTSAHGVTRNILSLVSSTLNDTSAALRAAEGLLHRPDFIGIHLEGPYISDRRCGAHDPAQLRDLDQAELDLLVSAPALRSITVAPERVTTDQVAQLVSAGKVVAIGHTDADYETVAEYFAAGATVLTHAFNAMRQIESRAPGPIIAALESGAWIELIADGIHVNPALARQIASWAGDKLVLVSDSMMAAGMPDGPYSLGAVDVVVGQGVARRSDNGALAGSTLTLDRAVGNLVAWGVTEELAIAAATVNPSECYGLPIDDFEIGSPMKFVSWAKSDTSPGLSLTR